MWGSIFSFEGGRFLWKLPRRIPYPVTVSFGTPMPPARRTAFEVRQAVQELGTERFPAIEDRRCTPRPRFRADSAPLSRSLCHGGRSRAQGSRFGAAFTEDHLHSAATGRRIGDEEMVGILLPPSVGGALVNFAATLLGRVPVNLNYTASDEVIASCAQQCELETVVTPRPFLSAFRI